MVLFDDENASMQAAGCVVFPVCAALAMSAGIGGGGLFVPLLMLILGKSVAEATSMSQCLIAGAAIAGLAYNSQQTHPTRRRPLILLDAVVFFAPLQMSGALMGNVLNQMLPKYLIVMTLVVVLILSATKSFSKGLTLYRHEGKASNRAQKLGDMVSAEKNQKFRSRTASKSPSSRSRKSPNSNRTPNNTVEMTNVTRTGQSPSNCPGGGNIMRLRNNTSPMIRSTASPGGVASGDAAAGRTSKTYAMRLFHSPQPNFGMALPKFTKPLAKTDSLKANGNSMKDLMSSIYDNDDGSSRYKALTDDENPEVVVLWSPVSEKAGQVEDAAIENDGDLETKEIIETFDKMKIGLLFAVWFLVLALIFARGGKGANSVFGLKYCGAGYWSVSGIAVVGLILFAAKVARDLVADTRAKQESGYMWAEGDLIWTPKLATQLAGVTIFAGVMAGLVGIGGGMVLGPVLLEAGYIPQVSSALTATNVLLSSTTVGVLVLVSGVVPIDESMFFFGICMLGAILGKFYLGKVIKRIGRTSIIIFTLVGVICLSIFVVLAKSIPVWVSEGFVGKFTGVCS